MLKIFKPTSIRYFAFLEKTQEYLMYLLPITLISGSFLPDLSISIISICFLFTIFIKHEWKYVKNKFFIIFIIWTFYLIIRSVLTENPNLSLQSSLFYWRFGIFSLAVWYLLDNIKNFKRNFFFITLIVFLFMSLDGFIQFVTGVNLIGNTYYSIDGQRISGLFGDEAILGNFTSRILPVLIALFFSFSKNYKIYSFMSVLFIFLSGSLILISGERTAFLYFSIFVFIIFLLLNKYRIEKLLIILVSIIFLTILFTSNSSIKQRFFLNTIIETQVSQGITLQNIIPKTYEPIYLSSYKIFLDNPYFGIGTKMYRYSCSKEEYFVENGCSTHPHNTYLQLLAETGIIGIMPVITIFIVLLFLYMKHLIIYLINRKSLLKNEEIILMSSIFISTFPFLPSLNFFHNWYSILTFLPVGFLLHLISIKKSNKL